MRGDNLIQPERKRVDGYKRFAAAYHCGGEAILYYVTHKNKYIRSFSLCRENNVYLHHNVIYVVCRKAKSLDK